MHNLGAGFVPGLCGEDAGLVAEQAALSFGGLLRQLRAEARLMPYWAMAFMNGPVTRSETICSTALAAAGLAT